jgi:predicted ribosome quality control (RQC) complex YloA/Tae2 family protein
MPFDGVFTSAIINELSMLENHKIDKVHQPSRDEIILQIKKDRKTVKVLLSANPSYPRVQITEQNKDNPQSPPTFCMILRKYLMGSRISSINQINFDRIIEFKVESKDELGYPTTFYLICEIMGKHSNIILLNEKRRIVDCIKHIGSDINRYREVLPGVNYIDPPTSNKTSPLLATKSYLDELFLSNQNISTSRIFTDNFLGISKLFSNEICGSHAQSKLSELSKQEQEIIISNFFYYMSKVKSKSFNYYIYYQDINMKDFYVFGLREYKDLKTINYSSPGEVLDIFYGQKNLKDSLKQKYHDLFRLITNLIEKNNKKLHIHNDKIYECKDYEKWKSFGDLIMASQYIINSDMNEVELENFYDPELSSVVIPLENGLSPVENAQKYYKKYAKEKITIETVTNQINETNAEQDYLETILFNLENATDIETIEEIKNELVENGYIRNRRRNNGKVKKSKPYHYRTADGYDIYVGKNNHQNDFLTMKFAISSDVWMHTKNIPGSHVIIKSKNGYVSDAALTDGALLAAFYSKAKNSATVPVDYTEKKNVKKPSGSKPGMVIYYTNKTIYITPSDEKVKKLQVVED